MLRHTSFTPGLRAFISKVLTPAVLVLGVLLLIFFNFNSVRKAGQVTNAAFQGDVTFSHGAFSYSFQETSGINRPILSYAGQDLLSYAEWSSTYSINGQVQELWNTYHGYDSDLAKRQVYSTASGDGWQLTEIVTLVDSHTVTVTFDFHASSTSFAPITYIFDIAHVTVLSHEWYNYHTGEGTFTAQVISGQGVPTGQPRSLGTLTLTATGDAVPTPAIIMPGTTPVGSRTGSIGLAKAFFTQYTVTNPSPGQLITLGTETLTFSPYQSFAGSGELRKG